tara:strand:- start:1206 stop:1373 length:168 start_codon:yes stop_codon:yes gene_type:complete
MEFDTFKNKVLKDIDNMVEYGEKLEFLNDLYMSTNDTQKEDFLLDCMQQLKFFGK